MSICLQSIVDEILRIRQGKPVKRVGDQQLFSPYCDMTVSSRKVIRIQKFINLGKCFDM